MYMAVAVLLIISLLFLTGCGGGQLATSELTDVSTTTTSVLQTNAVDDSTTTEWQTTIVGSELTTNTQTKADDGMTSTKEATTKTTVTTTKTSATTKPTEPAPMYAVSLKDASLKYVGRTLVHEDEVWMASARTSFA